MTHGAQRDSLPLTRRLRSRLLPNFLTFLSFPCLFSSQLEWHLWRFQAPVYCCHLPHPDPHTWPNPLRWQHPLHIVGAAMI
jgi:hypothetical protein